MRAPEIFTDPVAVVPVKDHARHPIYEDGLRAESFRAAREAEEITGSPFLQSFMRLKEGDEDPFNLMMRPHSSILPVSIIL